jgi:hypothetical protein
MLSTAEGVSKKEVNSPHAARLLTRQAETRANGLKHCQQPTSTHSIAIPIRHF